ncbi:MAG: type II toxin-antitoxin system Phd/YefM family antitoxin [bacterium]|nr:type II toxin-antitoxin system Phd/YefM family antitoxin [bacterium]MDE0235316.1 type II toxin-antitoxin system Phd/YefM family antitoxin [bacterium]
MSATEFRARCYRLMDEVAETGEEIVITKRGKPVAQLRPIRPVRKSMFGRDRDIIKILGDIEAPIDVEWDAETGKNWVEPLVLGQVHGSYSAASERTDFRGDGAGRAPAGDER